MKTIPIKVVIEIFVAIFLIILGIGIAYGIVSNAHQYHWLSGFTSALLVASLCVVGILDIRSRSALDFPVLKGISIVALVAIFGVIVASSASLSLNELKIAKYTLHDSYADTPFNFELCLEFYGWTLLDLLPGLEILKTLGINLPFSPKNPEAGIPIVLFRAYVIFMVLGSLKIWWGQRSN